MLPAEPAGMQMSPDRLLLIFFGMTASGKSTLGQAWATQHRAPYYNTDRVRKELAGLAAQEKRPDRVGGGIYSQAFTDRTYQALLDRTRGDFARGETMVVLDGSFAKRPDRDRVRALAAELGVRCRFILCTCSEPEVQRRLAVRAQDAQAVSDGRWEIYLHQQATFAQPGDEEAADCWVLPTEQPVPVLLAHLTTLLTREHQPADQRAPTR